MDDSSFKFGPSAGTASHVLDAADRAPGAERTQCGDRTPCADPVPRSRPVTDDGRVLAADGYRCQIRWRAGERLEHLFERRCDELEAEGCGERLAVDGSTARLTYAQLDARANRLARFLAQHAGIRPGHRVGLVLDEAVDGYVAMLAVMKLHAAYVPLDAGFPAERVAYIATDAGLHTVLSRSTLAPSLEELTGGVQILYVDEYEVAIAAQGGARLGDGEVGAAVDDLCYLIYTSGTTGRPKGVAVTHPSICNFVRVAGEVYGMRADDRVYQGLTIAFDFSVEEIWVAWMAGATLVPKPVDGSLLGADLGEFLRERRVTALCCVPTLLATLEDDLPELRFLLVSGETCPPDLVARWHRPGRRFLNVYGPTEATVTATWTLLHPGRKVTIGVPLPTYFTVVLDPDTDRTIPVGELGEIGIAGIGLAEGYVNRPDLTERAFARDFIGIPDNPSGRIYRTGDLGRINAEGELEHHGRIDTQVKVRGYRIELSEIEAVLRQAPGVAEAVVATHEPTPGTVELVGYFRARTGTGTVDVPRLRGHLRDRLPSYMVPAYLEELAVVPLTAGGKLDRKALPKPSGQRGVSSMVDRVPPATAVEALLARHLEQILGLDNVSVESHFFDELGADSLLMAGYAASLRRVGEGLRPASIKDLYMHPTIRELAAALSVPDTVEQRLGPLLETLGVGGLEQAEVAEPSGTPHQLLCGGLQLLTFLGYVCLLALGLQVGGSWLADGHGALDLYARAVVLGAGLLLFMGGLPILAKWTLIGRFNPVRIRVWSFAYVRFWIVKTLLVLNPVARLCVGTPLYGLYLRALGAKVGAGAAIFTTHVPVCTDLVSIGDRAVVRKDAFLNGYRARAGVIETGAVTIGADAFVGEQTVLDIDTAIGDGAQLGHSSSLQCGQSVPAGECWHGSPAQPAGADHDYQPLPAADCGLRRRLLHGAGLVIVLLAAALPLEAALAAVTLAHVPLIPRPDFAGVLLVAAVIFGAGVLGSIAAVVTVPRLLTKLLEPGRVYPLYGFHYTVARTISGISNVPFLTALFGDSALIVHYLRAIGYRLGQIVQTGSNFGIEVKHEIPALSEIGSGTMVSDGLHLINAEYSASSFRVVQARVGAGNFLGNNVRFPADARTGDNCLLATKVMIPIAGPVRHDVGLLGSPCFEIPRSVLRDSRVGQLADEAELRRRLAAKLRYNLATIGLYLLASYVLVAGLVFFALMPFGGIWWRDWDGVAATVILDLSFSVAFFILVDRALTGFRRLVPRFCSIYDPEFWRHERMWKLSSSGFIGMFDGTPFKSLAWRALGMRVGRRLFDDGCGAPERTLVTLGDDVTLGMGSEIQCHSLEDGAFKSDHVVVGSGCTVGTSGWVSYGAVLGEGSVLEADSFLMKGSHLAAGSRWCGNPAMEITTDEGVEHHDGL